MNTGMIFTVCFWTAVGKKHGKGSINYIAPFVLSLLTAQETHIIMHTTSFSKGTAHDNN